MYASETDYLVLLKPCKNWWLLSIRQLIKSAVLFSSTHEKAVFHSRLYSYPYAFVTSVAAQADTLFYSKGYCFTM